jgi:hypothetical protein
MRPARFVTLCFLYSGVVLLTQYLIVHRFALGLGGLARLGVALSVFGVGLIRLRSPEIEADNPAEFGAFAYGMAALSVLLTLIFLAQLWLA